MISAKRNGSSPSLHANGAVGALGHDEPKEPHSLALSEENMNDSSEENLSEGSGAFLEPIAESSAPPTSRRESKSGAAGSRFPAAGESGRGNFVVPRPLPNIDPLKAERLEQRLTAFTSTTPFSSSPFTTTTSITSTPTSTSSAASSTVSSLLATSVTPSPSTAAPSTAPALQSQTLVTDQPQPSLTVPTFSDFMAIEENLSKSGDEGNKDGDSTSSSRMTKRKRFTLEEDKKLVEGYNAFGNDWEKIRSWGNMERTADQLTRRFSRLKKSHPDILQQVSSSSKTSSSSVVSKLDRTSQDMLSPESSQPPRKVQRLNSTVLDDGAGPSAATPPAPSVLIPSGQTCPRGSEQDVEYPSLSSGDEFIPKDKRIEETSRLEELRVQQERLLVDQERLAQLETALKEKELALLERESQLQHQFEQAHAKSRAMIQELLIQASEREREEDRQKVMMDCLRLGQLVFERHGTEYHEIWREGKAFKDLKKKKDILVNKRNALEEQRKQLRKTKTKSASSGASSSSSAGSSSSTGGGSDEGVVEDAAYEEYVQIQEEIIRLQLQRFKKEEAELEEQLNKLVFEKKLHIRELKRASDEDNSRFNNHPVLNQRYLLLNLLGKGGFSEVYKAHDLQENRQVACKIHQLHSFWGEAKKQNYTKHAVREYKIHKDLNHARVVSLFDVFKIDESSFCTVLEYCDGGDLDMYLKTRNRLSEKEARIIVLQIFSGLKYLNEQKRPIIHYDLKPGNILFSDGAVKITDFGLSKIMEENTNAMELTSQGAGTYWYLPPECFEVGKQAPRISSKVDVWSAGVIFYQLLYGKKPFGNSFSQQKLLVENVITQACKVEFPSKPAVTQQCKNFIRRCLIPNQHLRPDVLSICNDPYLKEPWPRIKK